MAIIEQLVFQIPGAEEILKVKGVGMIMTAGFIAEIGDINRFAHANQIQKLAGLNLKKNSSGKHKGKTSISKRGRRRLRVILFQGILPSVATNAEFQDLHRYYTTRTNYPLKKKQSLILLCCKLIRIFYALLKKRTAYDPQNLNIIEGGVSVSTDICLVDTLMNILNIQLLVFVNTAAVSES